MAISPFESAINQICDEKKISHDIVISTIEQALAAAYRKEYGEPKEIVRCEVNLDDLAKSKMFQVFNVVKDDELEEEANQITLKEAKKKNKKLKIEDEYIIKLPPKADFGRIAAQTAKQVIIQRLQEAERDVLFDEYKDKEGTITNAVIQQISPREIVLNLGRTNAILPRSEQMPNEKYYIGQRLKIFVVSVERSTREPKVLVSRSRAELIENLFEMEVPEIATGSVKIEAITREAGARTKVAVSSQQEGLDPVGSCVGQRGIRIQSVLSEINGEKIDIILYDKNPEKFIINALSPAKIEKVTINKKDKSAKVKVQDDQLSLAIGKNGQNVRLASKLTDYKIDIVKDIKKDESSIKNDSKEIENKKAETKKEDKVKKPKNKKSTKDEKQSAKIK